MSNTTYTTKGGERWDTIADKAYGDQMRVSEIRRANPHLPSYMVFPAGITLNIPIVEPATAQSNLPPWKQ